LRPPPRQASRNRGPLTHRTRGSADEFPFLGQVFAAIFFATGGQFDPVDWALWWAVGRDF